MFKKLSLSSPPRLLEKIDSVNRVNQLMPWVTISLLGIIASASSQNKLSGFSTIGSTLAVIMTYIIHSKMKGVVNQYKWEEGLPYKYMHADRYQKYCAALEEELNHLGIPKNNYISNFMQLWHHALTTQAVKKLQVSGEQLNILYGCSNVDLTTITSLVTSFNLVKKTIKTVNLTMVDNQIMRELEKIFCSQTKVFIEVSKLDCDTHYRLKKFSNLLQSRANVRANLAFELDALGITTFSWNGYEWTFNAVTQSDGSKRFEFSPNLENNDPYKFDNNTLFFNIKDIRFKVTFCDQDIRMISPDNSVKLVVMKAAESLNTLNLTEVCPDASVFFLSTAALNTNPDQDPRNRIKNIMSSGVQRHVAFELAQTGEPITYHKLRQCPDSKRQIALTDIRDRRFISTSRPFEMHQGYDQRTPDMKRDSESACGPYSMLRMFEPISQKSCPPNVWKKQSDTFSLLPVNDDIEQGKEHKL